MATITLPDELAKRVEPFSRWLPTVLEISLLALKTPAIKTASEIVEFLTSNPSPREVHAYHVSKHAQVRMKRLLALNRAGVLGEAEARELDELISLEHLIITLKANLVPEDTAAA
ncbi:MAG: hypothetical protein M3511_08405 [Deinococcota bacterium]|jgi:hypothetical protein|nr:hypothetical protein [Deinococcota bacterium]